MPDGRALGVGNIAGTTNRHVPKTSMNMRAALGPRMRDLSGSRRSFLVATCLLAGACGGNDGDTTASTSGATDPSTTETGTEPIDTTPTTGTSTGTSRCRPAPPATSRSRPTSSSSTARRARPRRRRSTSRRTP
ncbi:hypothetical protein [Nannocystis pusilla]|uniref:hypothetical protein n=1 Tax=Nannocystis pusilla TaxID=889268 RepID=UPI003B773E6B